MLDYMYMTSEEKGDEYMAEQQVQVEPIPSPQPKRRRWKRGLFFATLIVVLLIVIGVIGISIYVGYEMTHPEQKPIDQLPSDYGIDFEDISFVSHDGETNLSGWVLHPERDAHMTIIFGHGYKGNRFEDHISFFDMADRLIDLNYRVVMFDFRYSGESEGDMTTVGAKEQLDMLGAIDFVKDKYDEPIGLLGISMGASAAILAAAQSDDVIGVVADSPFSDLEEYLRDNLPVWSGLPNIPFTPLILTLMPKLTDLDPKDASPISVLDDVAPRPILFIHNKGDASIPYSESEQMVAEHPNIFSLWLTDGEGHVKSFQQNEKEYIERVDEFFKEVMEK